MSATGLGAVFADAADRQPVAGGTKAVLASNGIANPEDLVAVELEQAAALRAVHVIVLRVSVVVLVHAAAIVLGNLSQQSGFY